MKASKLSRRMFLQGAQGFALAVPWLASWEAEAAPTPPLRFMCVASAFGRCISDWVGPHPRPVTEADFSTGALTDYAADISPIFGPAYDRSLRQKMAIASGLDLMGWTDGHAEWIVLTGGGSGRGDPNAFGESLDCVLERSKKFYPTTPMLTAIRAAPMTSSSLSVTSRFSHFQVVTPRRTAAELYQLIFDPAGVTRRAERNAGLARATHLAYDDYRRTMNSRRLSLVDRHRLDQYMTIMSEIEQRIAQTPSITCNQLPPNFTTSASSAEALHDLFFDMEVAALQCGITKLVLHTLKHVQTELSAVGGPDFHACAHNNTRLTATGLKFTDYNRWTMNCVASAMKKLDAVIDSDGNTLLDNTLFFYSSTDSSGSHSSYDMPVLLAGAKGVLRTNTWVDYRQPAPSSNRSPRLGRPYNNLLVSMLNAFGLEQADYSIAAGQAGFGEYSDGLRRQEPYYRPMVTTAARRAKLPHLFL